MCSPVFAKQRMEPCYVPDLNSFTSTVSASIETAALPSYALPEEEFVFDAHLANLITDTYDNALLPALGEEASVAASAAAAVADNHMDPSAWNSVDHHYQYTEAAHFDGVALGDKPAMSTVPSYFVPSSSLQSTFFDVSNSFYSETAW